MATWRWKHPHLDTEDHISYFALNETKPLIPYRTPGHEVHPTGTSIFHPKKSLASSNSKVIWTLVLMETSQTAIFQYCLKQMFTKCLQFPCAQQGKNEKKLLSRIFSTPKDALRCKVSSKWSKANTLASQDHLFLSMATGRFPLNHDGRKLIHVNFDPLEVQKTIRCCYHSIRFPNLKCEHKQSGKQGWHQEPSN